MEPQVMEYLNRIARSIGITLLWMGLNSTFGIMMGYAFIEVQWKWENIFYYFFLLLSFGGYAFILYKIWSKPIGFDLH